MSKLVKIFSFNGNILGCNVKICQILGFHVKMSLDFLVLCQNYSKFLVLMTNFGFQRQNESKF